MASNIAFSSLSQADVPERLRGMTRNHLGNACVAESCRPRIYIFFVFIRTAQVESCRPRVYIFFVFIRTAQVESCRPRFYIFSCPLSLFLFLLFFSSSLFLFASLCFYLSICFSICFSLSICFSNGFIILTTLVDEQYAFSTRAQQSHPKVIPKRLQHNNKAPPLLASRFTGTFLSSSSCFFFALSTCWGGQQRLRAPNLT